eukprot:533593-Pleurochrysis_carterae.AAC.1
MEIRADVGEHGLDSHGGQGRSSDQADEARFRGASTSARSGIGFGDAYGAARLQCGVEERFPVSAIL